MKEALNSRTKLKKAFPDRRDSSVLGGIQVFWRPLITWYNIVGFLTSKGWEKYFMETLLMFWSQGQQNQDFKGIPFLIWMGDTLSLMFSS